MKRQLHVLFSILVVLSVSSSASSAGALMADNSALFTPASSIKSPVANPGPGQTVDGGTKNVVLDGSKSYDPTGRITSYSWEQTAGPAVKLNSTNTPVVKFNATCETTNHTLAFRLTLRDNNSAVSSSLVHVKVTNGPSSAICKEAVFTSSTLPLAFASGTSYPFKVNLGTKFSSVSRVIAISKYEPSDPFVSGDKYFIDNFGGQNATTGAQTLTILSITDHHITDQFLGGNFTSKYFSKQGKFTLTSLKFCLEGVPSNNTGLLKNSSFLASKSKDIKDECNISTSPLRPTIKNATGTGAIPNSTSTVNSTRVNGPRYQYSLPQQYYASPSSPNGYSPYQYPYQYQNPYPYQYPYPNSPSTTYPYYPPSPYPYQNQPPIANAGPSQVVSPGAFVVLNGAGSYSPSGGYITSYQWQQIGGAPFVALAGANTPTPTFTAPFVTAGSTLIFSLIVTSSNGGTSSPSTVSVSITPNNINQRPIAIATPQSQVVSRGSAVTLDGTGSFDPSGGSIIFYSWVQTSGITVALNGANTATPTFIAPSISFGNTLMFSLTVTNSAGVQSVITQQSIASVIVR
jgi:hypothetical protein